MAKAHAYLRNRHDGPQRAADQRVHSAAPMRRADPAVIEVTEDERSRIIAGLAFFHGMRRDPFSNPWGEWRAAEAEIDAVLKPLATQSERPK